MGSAYCFNDDKGSTSFTQNQARTVVKSFCNNNHVLDPGNTYGFVDNLAGQPSVIVFAGWARDQSGSGDKKSWSFSWSSLQYDLCLNAWSTDYFCKDEYADAATSYGGGYVYNTGNACILLKLYAKIERQGPIHGPIVANSTTTAGQDGTAWSSSSTESDWSVSNGTSIANKARLFD